MFWGPSLGLINDLPVTDFQRLVTNRTKELQNLGIGKSSVCAVLSDASEQLCIDLLAILAIGAVYYPVRTIPPNSTLTTGNIHVLDGYELPCNDIAYIMTTSGTTGVCKKVHVPMQALISNITAISDRLAPGSNCTFLLVSPPTFDPSLVEILIPLSTGNSLLIPPTVKSPKVLFPYIAKTTHLMLTPSLFFTLTPKMQQQILSGFTKVTHLIFGGEPFPNQIILSSKIQLWNFYGTTECSIWASLTKVDSNVASVDNFLGDTIGRVIDGELWIGGPCRKCYVDNEIEAPEMRPTGDLAEIINGKIYCLGRRDYQVKRSGYRINLNVISETAQIYPFISAKALLVQDPIETLVLFISTADSKIIDLVKAKLKDQLDWFACPDLYFKVPKWPVNNNGKVNVPELLQQYQMLISKPKETCKSYNEIVSKVRLILARYVLIHNDNEFFLAAHGNSLNAARSAYEISKLVETPPETLQQDILASLLNEPISNLFHILEHVFLVPKKRRNTEMLCSDRFQLLKLAPALYSEWSFDMEKCIDATPVIYNDEDIPVIYLGSHSGLFAAITLMKGKLIWEFRAPDRIESSAAVVKELVVFGCYDHFVYALDRKTGQLHGSFETTGQVKCSPTVDPVTLEVWIGCHGNTLYCLDYSLKKIEKLHLQLDHAIYASVCIGSKHVFCCTTGGFVYCISKQGSIIWHQQPSGKPIFASPISHNDNVIVTCVDGQIYILKQANGSTVRQISIEGPIFCTPILLHIDKQVLCAIGTHACNLHVFNIEKTDHTSVKFDSAIFASSVGNAELITVSTKGRLKCHSVAADTSCIELWNRTIPGMIFSTPVLVDDFILQASRNNTLTLFSIRKATL